MEELNTGTYSSWHTWVRQQKGAVNEAGLQEDSSRLLEVCAVVHANLEQGKAIPPPQETLHHHAHKRISVSLSKRLKS